MKICSLEECSRGHWAKSFCRKHYNRFLISGNPRVTSRVTSEMSNIDKLNFYSEEAPDGCIVWHGAKNVYGYGVIRINDKLLMAHRLSYTEHVCTIPVGMYVLHKCDNPPCVNHDHLFIGTQKDNIDDMISKGRNLLGEKAPWSKLNNNDVADIRVLISNGVTQREVAEKYNIAQSTISFINTGARWKHI